MKNNNDEILHVIYDYTSKGDDELTLKYEKNILRNNLFFCLFLKTWKYIRSFIER
jgi:hypothetical protein